MVGHNQLSYHKAPCKEIWNNFLNPWITCFRCHILSTGISDQMDWIYLLYAFEGMDRQSCHRPSELLSCQSTDFFLIVWPLKFACLLFQTSVIISSCRNTIILFTPFLQRDLLWTSFGFLHHMKAFLQLDFLCD